MIYESDYGIFLIGFLNCYKPTHLSVICVFVSSLPSPAKPCQPVLMPCQCVSFNRTCPLKWTQCRKLFIGPFKTCRLTESSDRISETLKIKYNIWWNCPFKKPMSYSSILLWVYTSTSSKIENNSCTDLMYLKNTFHLINEWKFYFEDVQF